jgi:hypothetical protein
MTDKEVLLRAVEASDWDYTSYPQALGVIRRTINRVPWSIEVSLGRSDQIVAATLSRRGSAYFMLRASTATIISVMTALDRGEPFEIG